MILELVLHLHEIHLQGKLILYGEYLINAQGEDVVAGIRTPQPIHILKQDMPEVYKKFTATCELLEKHYKDMQDIEFTVERGSSLHLANSYR